MGPIGPTLGHGSHQISGRRDEAAEGDEEDGDDDVSRRDGFPQNLNRVHLKD